jgi:Na+-driven multidrug efflux pump
MERNRARWQGLGVILIGVFFLILTSVLYDLHHVKAGQLGVFYGLSAFLIVIGVVLLVLYQRMPRQQITKKAAAKEFT